MVFLWSFSEVKSLQYSWTFLSILAILNNAVVWMVSLILLFQSLPLPLTILHWLYQEHYYYYFYYYCCCCCLMFSVTLGFSKRSTGSYKRLLVLYTQLCLNEQRGTSIYRNISLILFSKGAQFVDSLRDRWRDIYSERGHLLVPYLLWGARGCQRLPHLASRIVRDHSDWLPISRSSLYSLDSV